MTLCCLRHCPSAQLLILSLHYFAVSRYQISPHAPDVASFAAVNNQPLSKCSRQISLQVVSYTSPSPAPPLGISAQEQRPPAPCWCVVEESPWQSSGAVEWFEPCEVLAGAVAGAQTHMEREGDTAEGRSQLIVQFILSCWSEVQRSWGALCSHVLLDCSHGSLLLFSFFLLIFLSIIITTSVTFCWSSAGKPEEKHTCSHISLRPEKIVPLSKLRL